MNEQTNEHTSPIINTDCMLATNFYVIQENKFSSLLHCFVCRREGTIWHFCQQH